MSIAHLPDDIVLVIFNCFETYLELLKSVSGVCKRWNHLARNQKILDQLTLKEIGIPIPITTMETSILWRDSTQAPSLMGKNSIEALHKIFTVINNQNSYKGLKTQAKAAIKNLLAHFKRTLHDEDIAGLESRQLTAFTEIIKIIKTFHETYTLRVSYLEISTLRRFYQLKIGLLALLV